MGCAASKLKGDSQNAFELEDLSESVAILKYNDADKKLIIYQDYTVFFMCNKRYIQNQLNAVELDWLKKIEKKYGFVTIQADNLDIQLHGSGILHYDDNEPNNDMSAFLFPLVTRLLEDLDFFNRP